jgi:hypothetical protein
MRVLIFNTLPLDAALLTIDVALVEVSEVLLFSPKMLVTLTMFGAAILISLVQGRKLAVDLIASLSCHTNGFGKVIKVTQRLVATPNTDIRVPLLLPLMPVNPFTPRCVVRKHFAVSHVFHR